MSGPKFTYSAVRWSRDGASDELLASPSSTFTIEDIEDEEANSLLSEKSQQGKDFVRPRRWTSSTVVITVLNIAIFLISLALFVASRSQTTTLLNAELRQASTYSNISSLPHPRRDRKDM